MFAEVTDVEAEDIFVKFSIDSGLEKKRRDIGLSGYLLQEMSCIVCRRSDQE